MTTGTDIEEVCRMTTGRDRFIAFGFHEYRGRMFLDIVPWIPDRETGKPTAKRGITLALDSADEFVDSLRIVQSKAALD